MKVQGAYVQEPNGQSRVVADKLNAWILKMDCRMFQFHQLYLLREETHQTQKFQGPYLVSD